MPKNWCFWTVVLEKTLESALDCKEIQPVHPKGDQPWIFIGRTDAEAPIRWPPDVKSRLIGKDPDAGKDWGQEKRVAKDEMVGWHHWLHGYAFGQTQRRTGNPGVLQFMGSKSQTQLNEWATSKTTYRVRVQKYVSYKSQELLSNMVRFIIFPHKSNFKNKIMINIISVLVMYSCCQLKKKHTT